ncbi:MAG: diaminopimelate decarboxylase [Thermoleophilia bacterium]|jgi:diaminopimelate decarboxylase
MMITVPPLPKSSRINAAGHLEVAGCDVVELVQEYGSPLFIYDEQQVRERCQEYIQAFSSRTDDFEIVYASKAFSCLAMCQLLAEEHMSLDVASGGELFTALKTWFPPEHIYMHGNANSRDELQGAIRSHVGYIVADSLDELSVVNELAGEQGRRQPVLLRITPGIEAHTHDFIQTGKLDSKFGFCLAEGKAEEAVSHALGYTNLELVGFHSHIGSQIFSLEPYRKAIGLLADFMDLCHKKYEFNCRILDVGGGLGAIYTTEDTPASVDELAEVIIGSLQTEMARVGLPIPHVVVEPGRSIVANAGLTAYTIQTIKTIPSVKTYVAVDGGMSDNLRPMLYQASYEALIANRPEAAPTLTADIAGKHCESGDILVKEASLPNPRPGDVLITPATGAYGYSMSNNYNGQTRPAVLFVKDGAARVIIRRETYEDLVHLQSRME